MNRRLLAVIGVVLVVAGILAMSSFFIVDQTEQALVLQFGQPRRVIREPGLWVKRPFVENVIHYDTRVLDFEPPHEEVIVSDQKRLVADTYTRYRIGSIVTETMVGISAPISMESFLIAKRAALMFLVSWLVSTSNKSHPPSISPFACT